MGTNRKGQTEPKRRFSQILTDFSQILAFSLENKAFGNADPQIFAGNRRKAQEPAENPQKTRRLACVPLGSSP